MTQCNEWVKLLEVFEKLIDGTLGTWKTDPVYFEWKEAVKPICSGPYPVTKVHEKMLKKEVKYLVLLGVLEVANNSDCVSSSFTQLKPESNWVSFLSNFRKLNKLLKQKTYPMHKINEMLLKLESFQYSTSFDLNIGYYHIQLSENASNIFTIMLPWVNIVTNL